MKKDKNAYLPTDSCAKRALFAAGYLSRRLITLQKQMLRDGCDITIASPAGENLAYLPDGRFIRLHKIGRRLFGASRIRSFPGKKIYFDAESERLVRRAKIPASGFADKIGIDLSVWNPKAISGNRQTMLLRRYNIAPHQKMILVIGLSDKDIRPLILAIQRLERSDFIIAVYGKIIGRTARKLSRRAEDVPGIIYLGAEQDLPSMMRASFAIIVLDEGYSFYKTAATAMGRATAWKIDAGQNIRPNIPIRGDIGEALERLLDLPLKTREKFEAENERRAADWAMSKNIAKLKKMI